MWGEHTYNNRIRTEKQRPRLQAIARQLFRPSTAGTRRTES